MAAEGVTVAATPCEAAATGAGMAGATPFAVEAGIMAAAMRCGVLVTVPVI